MRGNQILVPLARLKLQSSHGTLLNSQEYQVFGVRPEFLRIQLPRNFNTGASACGVVPFIVSCLGNGCARKEPSGENY